MTPIQEKNFDCFEIGENLSFCRNTMNLPKKSISIEHNVDLDKLKETGEKFSKVETKKKIFKFKKTLIILVERISKNYCEKLKELVNKNDSNKIMDIISKIQSKSEMVLNLNPNVEIDKLEKSASIESKNVPDLHVENKKKLETSEEQNSENSNKEEVIQAEAEQTEKIILEEKEDDNEIEQTEQKLCQSNCFFFFINF